jgi:hypothetical protein
VVGYQPLELAPVCIGCRDRVTQKRIALPGARLIIDHGRVQKFSKIWLGRAAPSTGSSGDGSSHLLLARGRPVNHAVPATWRSLAAARLSADSASRNAPTTRV